MASEWDSTRALPQIRGEWVEAICTLASCFSALAGVRLLTLLGILFSSWVRGTEGTTTSTNLLNVVNVETYVLAPGDRLSYRVEEDRDPVRHLVVSPTGEVDVPYLGRVSSVGKTTTQLSKEIKQQLEKELYHQATVYLSLEEVAPKVGPELIPVKPKQISVVGAVRTQGAQDMPVDEKYMVSQAIIRAGGFSSFANGRAVKIYRKLPDGRKEEIEVDVNSVLKDGNLENDVELKPGDLVVVKEKLFNF